MFFIFQYKNKPKIISIPQNNDCMALIKIDRLYQAWLLPRQCKLGLKTSGGPGICKTTLYDSAFLPHTDVTITYSVFCLESLFYTFWKKRNG